MCCNGKRYAPPAVIGLPHDLTFAEAVDQSRHGGGGTRRCCYPSAPYCPSRPRRARPCDDDSTGRAPRRHCRSSLINLFASSKAGREDRRAEDRLQSEPSSSVGYVPPYADEEEEVKAEGEGDEDANFEIVDKKEAVEEEKKEKEQATQVTTSPPSYGEAMKGAA